MDKNQEESYLKSLVGDYLTSVSPNLAKKFKNGNKVKPLPAGSPTLLELVKEHQKNSPIKRKLNMSNGHTPAKKAKKVKYFVFEARSRLFVVILNCYECFEYSTG